MNKLLNEINKTRIKIYYNLNELSDITGLKTRALKYRMLEVKEKYTDITHLLRKEGRSWKIHYTLIIEFMPNIQQLIKRYIMKTGLLLVPGTLKTIIQLIIIYN
jgi:hypothetical protein